MELIFDRMIERKQSNPCKLTLKSLHCRRWVGWWLASVTKKCKHLGPRRNTLFTSIYYCHKKAPYQISVKAFEKNPMLKIGVSGWLGWVKRTPSQIIY